MAKRLILDEAKYRLFMEENSSWKDTIKAHATEIPRWEKILAAAMDKKEKESTDKIEISNAVEKKISPGNFSGQLVQQHKEMIELHAAIITQEKRLQQRSEVKQTHDFEALNTQDILRERIKEIEHSYHKLKNIFYKHFSSML